jgi:AcrR family transcriptional regulator
VPRRQPLRRDESQAQTREALLAAGGRLFDLKGYAATSITDIADEAGYTTGALYSNFSSKEDLFLGVLDRQLTIEIAELREALSRETTVRARLEVVGAWYVSQAGRGRRRTRALTEMAMLTRNGEATLERLREQRKVLHQAVGDLLHQQEVELGIRFRMPVPALATAVMALLEGFVLGSAVEHDLDESALVPALELLLRPARPAGG